MNNLIIIFTAIVLFTIVLNIFNVISDKNMTKFLLIVLPIAIITLSKDNIWPNNDINTVSDKTTQIQKTQVESLVNKLTGKNKSYMESEQYQEKVSMELTFLDDNKMSQTTLTRADNQFELFGLIEKICAMTNDRIVESNKKYENGKAVGEIHATEQGHVFFIHYYGQAPDPDNI